MKELQAWVDAVSAQTSDTQTNCWMSFLFLVAAFSFWNLENHSVDGVLIGGHISDQRMAHLQYPSRSCAALHDVKIIQTGFLQMWQTSSDIQNACVTCYDLTMAVQARVSLTLAGRPAGRLAALELQKKSEQRMRA